MPKQLRDKLKAVERDNKHLTKEDHCLIILCVSKHHPLIIINN